MNKILTAFFKHEPNLKQAIMQLFEFAHLCQDEELDAWFEDNTKAIRQVLNALRVREENGIKNPQDSAAYVAAKRGVPMYTAPPEQRRLTGEALVEAVAAELKRPIPRTFDENMEFIRQLHRTGQPAVKPVKVDPEDEKTKNANYAVEALRRAFDVQPVGGFAAAVACMKAGADRKDNALAFAAADAAAKAAETAHAAGKRGNEVHEAAKSAGERVLKAWNKRPTPEAMPKTSVEVRAAQHAEIQQLREAVAKRVEDLPRVIETGLVSVWFVCRM
jgi:hypothetical protein